MSHYQTRWCATHGDWDDDVDSPAEACPTCIEQGLFKTRAQLEREWAGMKDEIRLLNERLAQRPSGDTPSMLPATAAAIEEALWALHNYESNRDDAVRVFSEVEISNMVTAVRAAARSSTVAQAETRAEDINAHVQAQQMGGEDRYSMGYNAGVAKMAYLWKCARASASSATATPREKSWISVSERLPSKDEVREFEAGVGNDWQGKVLGYAPSFPGGRIAAASFYCDFYDGSKPRVMLDGRRCTYWQPLPSVPTDDKAKG